MVMKRMNLSSVLDNCCGTLISDAESTFSLCSSRVEWNLLPSDVQLRILACLQIEDLLGSCLLVCKQWKDAILSSDYFSRFQYRHSWWGYLNIKRARSSKLQLFFQNGRYTMLNLNLKLAAGEFITCSDKGIVCIRSPKPTYMQMKVKVGNPLKDDWKVIPIPLQCSYSEAMSVDTSTSPASFKIVTCRLDFRNLSVLHARIFDSKTNTWSKGNTISLDGPFQDKVRRTLVFLIRVTQKIVTYDFEQDIWSVQSYLLPEKAGRHQIILCKEEPILVSYLWLGHALEREALLQGHHQLGFNG